jgi:hypothetical protein
LTNAAATAGAAPTMCTHPKCQRLAATIVEDKLELVATIVDKRARGAVMDAYK